jgi:substrate-binding family protein
MLAALTAAAITLVAAAAIGGRQAASAAPTEGEVAAPGSEGGGEIEDVPDSGELVEGPAVKPGASGAPSSVAPGAAAPTAPGSAKKPNVPAPSTAGATREGIFSDHFEFGIHAPATLDGVPLNLAEDPITGVKGYVTYLNRNGGINGRKMKIYPVDDRYTTAGGQQAADQLTKEIKPFIISGTLGIDQIAKVAKAAGARKIPYIAGGGPEPEFKSVGMYQLLSSYDQYLDMTIDFICTYGKKYLGVTKATDIRLGTTTLNSENILPVEKRFVTKISARKCVRTPVDAKARGTINKPTEQTSYSAQMLDLRSAYTNQGANLIIPLQDPITTSRQVAEWAASGYRPEWTIANFAHDSNTVLELMHSEWTGTQVMSGACYYHPKGGADPYNAARCSKMGEAHRDWVSLGQVTYDENAGGSFGGKSSYDYNEDSWETDGSGGASGYQIIYFPFGAMKAIGTDPTREKFFAAISAYDNYSNILTGPITFKGTANTMIGAKKFVLLEGQANLEYRQVKEITPGLVDHF